MKKKITSIRFINYKAFYGDGGRNIINIPDGKNLLIYGENGSGKSSVYEGLKQFFNSSDNTVEIVPSRHIAVTKTNTINQGTDEEKEEITKVAVIASFLNENGDIEEKEFGVPNETVKGTSYISKANLLNSFLSYRELLKTYLMDNLRDKKEFRIKFASLVIETILAKNINSATQNTYVKAWDNLFIPRVWYKEENLEKFLTGLKYDIYRINLILNEILKYFEPDLEVQLSFEDAYIDYIYSAKMNRWGKYPTCEIDLKVNLFGLEVENDEENHLTVLNEARLSALAISIYLSSLVNTTQDNFEFKILFLDDIFIGLDTGNRLPLLKILSNFKKPIINQFVDPTTNIIVEEIQTVNGEKQYEIEPFFNGFQIFVTTYDKHWFEIAKYYLPENSWQNIEMYSYTADGISFDMPLIISPVLDYYQKAEAYFKKKSDYKDFPASANYLRKESEQQFKRLLYGNYLFKNGEKGSTALREELDELRQSFEKLISDLDLDYSPFNDFSTIVKTTLNPLSHDNLQKPIYAREIDEAFVLVDELRSIRKELFLKKGDVVSLITNNNGLVRITSLSVINDVFKYNQKGNKKITPIFLKPLRYEQDGAISDLTRLKECTIEKAYDMIYHDVYALNNASNGKNILIEFVFNAQILNDLLNV